MKLYTLIECDEDWLLELPVCRAPSADEVVESFGHTPNGYFWEGIAMLLLEAELEAYAERVDHNAEGDAYVAHGDHEALLAMGEALTGLLEAPEALHARIARALDEGFEFDD